MSGKPRKKKPRKVVVYAGTRNLYQVMLPSIRSLTKNTKVDRIVLLIEDDEFPYQLPANCEVMNVSGQQFFSKDSPNWRQQFSWMTLMRATYTKLFPEEEKILQLDVDTIVCEDLSPLWDIDLSGFYMAAVNEYTSRTRPFGPGKYYNIGVCLFNLAEIRKDGIDDQAIEFLKRQRTEFVDQDAWNKFCAGKIYELDVRYNETRYTGLTDNPAIVHFAGTRGGWYSNRNVFRAEYVDPYRDDQKA
jgi:lipopolysaccharide biosynthesis glycosyltransferase